MLPTLFEFALYLCGAHTCLARLWGSVEMVHVQFRGCLQLSLAPPRQVLSYPEFPATGLRHRPPSPVGPSKLPGMRLFLWKAVWIKWCRTRRLPDLSSIFQSPDVQTLHTKLRLYLSGDAAEREGAHQSFNTCVCKIRWRGVTLSLRQAHSVYRARARERNTTCVHVEKGIERNRWIHQYSTRAAQNIQNNMRRWHMWMTLAWPSLPNGCDNTYQTTLRRNENTQSRRLKTGQKTSVLLTEDQLNDEASSNDSTRERPDRSCTNSRELAERLQTWARKKT